MKLLHEIAIFQTVKSKVIISLFEIVRLSVSISLRNLYNSLNNIKETFVFLSLQMNQQYLMNISKYPHPWRTEQNAYIIQLQRQQLANQKVNKKVSLFVSTIPS